MNDKRKIDELLNAYMDGELDQRRQTEVKRLIQHDAEVARQISELIKIRGLLGAIPKAQTQRGFVEQVKERLEHKSMVGSYEDFSETDEGVKQLFWRRVVSVAAIVALAVVLGGVIYNIVGLQPADNEKVISQSWINEQIEPVAKKAPAAEAAQPAKSDEQLAAAKEEMPRRLTAKLELSTDKFAGVDAYIKRAIVENGIMLVETPVNDSQNGVYNIRCGKTKATALVADIAAIWDKFDSATLRVDTGVPGRDVVVKDVQPKQINSIIIQGDVSKSLELAKSTAALNAMTSELPSMLATETNVDSLIIPKPVLTSGERTAQAEEIRESEMVELVIVIKS